MSSAPTKAFASQADLNDKKITFEQLSAHCWAYTAEGDPNSGVIIGDKYIMVSDATATPDMARDLIAKIRTVSDKPINTSCSPTTTRCVCWAQAPMPLKARPKCWPAVAPMS